MTCPCCGQVLPKNTDLLVDLNTNIVVRGDQRVQVSPQQAELLHVLAKAAPRQVGFDDITYALWGYLDGPEIPKNTVQVVISTLRKKLRGMGLAITNTHSCGYRLEIQ